MFNDWLRQLRRKFFGTHGLAAPATTRIRRKSGRRTILELECLENRLAPTVTIGSTISSPRTHTDTSVGQVYIYTGGSLPAGVTVSTMNVYFPNAGSTVLTPLLFEQTVTGQYTVEGIGTSYSVGSTGSQSYPFALQIGSVYASNGNYTFGFINAGVNLNGVQTGSSTGDVGYDSPADSGPGVSTGSTNAPGIPATAGTPTSSGITVGLGATFGTGGTYALNSGHTYSANLNAAFPMSGSTVVSRPNMDNSAGQVYIYSGDFLPVGVPANTLNFYADATGWVTPVLFEQSSTGPYTVEGVGESYDATTTGAQSVPFYLQYGSAVPTNASWTFGFITASVNSSGAQTVSSKDLVAWDPFVDTGPGVGGGTSSNAWEFTPNVSGLNVALNTTFGTGGTYALGSGRTYSATLDFPFPVSVAGVSGGGLGYTNNTLYYVVGASQSISVSPYVTGGGYLGFNAGDPTILINNSSSAAIFPYGSLGYGIYSFGSSVYIDLITDPVTTFNVDLDNTPDEADTLVFGLGSMPVQNVSIGGGRIGAPGSDNVDTVTLTSTTISGNLNVSAGTISFQGGAAVPYQGTVTVGAVSSGTYAEDQTITMPSTGPGWSALGFAPTDSIAIDNASSLGSNATYSVQGIANGHLVHVGLRFRYTNSVFV